MKVKYSTTWLASGGLDGTAGASWNGAQINDEAVFFRAAAASYFARGGRSTVFSFRVAKTFESEAALLLWAATHFSTLPGQADLILTDDAGTVAVTLVDAVIDQPRIGNVIGNAAFIEYTFKGGLFESDDVPEDSVVPSEDTVKANLVTLEAAAESGSIAFAIAFGSAPKGLILTICPPTGGTTFDAYPVQDTITAAGFDYVLNFPVPASGTYKLSWTAIL